MKMSQTLIDAPIVSGDGTLTADVFTHLQEHLPEVVRAYPPGYLLGLVRHSACLARDRFELTELAAIRLFVRLRWEIAPGFYFHPVIAQVLGDRSLRPMQRFDALTHPSNEHVWLEAMAHDGPEYWRGEKSHGFGDLYYNTGDL